MKNKPLILEIEDFKIELEQSVNGLLQKYNYLPIYLIEPTFSNIAKEIIQLAKYEIQMTRKEYERGEKENEIKCTDN